MIETVDGEYMNGIKLIGIERLQQIKKRGWTEEHDDEHDGGQLLCMALLYLRATREISAGDFTWDEHMGGPEYTDVPINNLQKAGACIAAEIDRRIRAETR